MKNSLPAFSFSLIIAIIFTFSACSDRSNPPPKPSASIPPIASSDTAPIPTAPPPRPRPDIEIVASRYAYGDIIEVPQIVGSSPAINSINSKIIAFADDYLNFIEGHEKIRTLEFKSYPIADSEYLQIVITRLVLPGYAAYGDIASFCYDYKNDREISLADRLAFDDIDTLNPENSILRTVPENFTLDSFSPDAFVITPEGTRYYYSVYLQNKNGAEPLKDLYIRYPDGSYDIYTTLNLYGQSTHLIPLDELERFEPPLYYDLQK